MNKDRRNEVLGSRMTRAERRLIEAAATAVHRSLSDYLRLATVAAARETIAGDPGTAR